MKIAKIICLTLAFSLSACVTAPDYELCEGANCGDPVDVIVE